MYLGLSEMRLVHSLNQRSIGSWANYNQIPYVIIKKSDYSTSIQNLTAAKKFSKN